MITQVCNKCNLAKSLDDYYRKKDGPLGRSLTCIECTKLYGTIYREKNKEKARLNSQEWRDNNLEQSRSGARKYYAENQVEILQRLGISRAENPQKAKDADRRYKLKHPDRIAMAAFNKQNRRRASIGNDVVTAQEWADLCDFYGNKCLCCSRSDVLLTKDHVISLLNGGWNLISNIQPLCKSCNSKKQAQNTDYRMQYSDFGG